MCISASNNFIERVSCFQMCKDVVWPQKMLFFFQSEQNYLERIKVLMKSGEVMNPFWGVCRETLPWSFSKCLWNWLLVHVDRNESQSSKHRTPQHPPSHSHSWLSVSKDSSTPGFYVKCLASLNNCKYIWTLFWFFFNLCM